MNGYVDPERAQFDAFKALDRDQPVEMLNLVRFRDKAAYPDGHELADAGLTGAQAYGRYGTGAAPIVDRIGASILWRGEPQAVLIGPQDEVWDMIFIARYPSAHAFLEMISDAEYQRAVIHRQAAVATSRLIRCGAAEAGQTFG